VGFPPNPADTGIDRFLAVIVMLLLWGFALLLVIRLLRRERAELRVGWPLAVGYGIRALAIPAVSLTGIGSSLRGGDEVQFISDAHTIAAHGLPSSIWNPFGTYHLYRVVFAAELKFGHLTVSTMRLTEVGLAMIGTALIVGSVYDLAGSRSARASAWLLAIEPASVFFSQLLHKEPFMMLASGLVVFGGTRIWRRLDGVGVILMGGGCAVAIATRPYAGWFLIGAAVILAIHASLRKIEQRGRAVSMLVGAVVAIALGVPFVLAQTTPQSLQRLQGSQTANSQAVGTPGNNLALEEVNFSSRSAIVTNLPRRVSDLVLRPWPWQVSDPSQRLGVVGTLIAYVALYMLVLYLLRWRRRAFELGAPLLYPLFFLTIAYALSVGNAGTGFRYRSQLVVLVIAAVIVLREHFVRHRQHARATVALQGLGRSATVSASAPGG
jgi:hypothetical protein